MKRTATLFLTLGTMIGCANPGIVQISPDTYLLAREAHGGIFASAAALKADVIRDANAFAARQGKVAIPISAKEKPMGNGPAQWASFEYQFRVVDKSDPAVRRTQLIHNPNVIIQRTDPDATDTRAGEQGERTKDVYSELLKLEDLRKRGILTDAEFEAQKKKLLESK
ncbi:MAG TPA: SHOCT domain-containing protein [Burkholderiales bacterium]|nr:SHOCT domain-containing protein [Burkholderiales bacterium]